MKTIILNLGINNIKSIKNASEKICNTKIINDKSEFIDCDRIILQEMDHLKKVWKKS